ncbi:MAG: nucleotide exchange factor GrpE [Parcubacteria group bacterium]|nr:nucleotide exchange factor GrpE [Parcubacteria group bacterium]
MGNTEEQTKIEEGAKDLEEKLRLAEKERDEYLNGWKRAKADLINIQKEWREKLADLDKWAQAGLVKQMLPVLDALEAAQEAEGWAEIRKLLVDILAKSGLEEIKALGSKFDPVYHESVGESEGEAGVVAEVVQRGYLFGGEVLRAARVKVGK